ncbi:MAG: suppressor of fused domain protein [Deltaproteobacteria bacterium]|nr:suppressor of fused domain protein [Deltaproteobacteria bacterium]
MTELAHAGLHHAETFWQGRRINKFSWDLGPIKDSIPGFVVGRVDQGGSDDAWNYFSIGACDVEREGRHEFVLASPVESPRHVETLAMVAHAYTDPRQAVGLGRVLNLGQPWLEGSESAHLLVSVPYPFGPKLEWCRAPLGTIHYLWLLPITASEAAYCEQHGVEALEQRLEEREVNYLSPDRPSVVA